MADAGRHILRDVRRLLGAVADEPSRPGPPSTFAVVAKASGTSLLTTKQTLGAFSHVLEEECLDDLDGAHLFGAFQRGEFYEHRRKAWGRLAAGARSAFVFADFETSGPPQPGAPVEVDLDPDSPLAREWSIVVDRPSGGVAFAARERADQHGVPDRFRLFDSAWTTDVAVVRRAARICALTASAADRPGADAVVYELGSPVAPTPPDPGLHDRLLDRLLGVLDAS